MWNAVLSQLRSERKKLLQAHYADAIMVDLLKEEQTRITGEESQAQRILDSCTLRFDEIERNLDGALTLFADCLEGTRRRPINSDGPTTRRSSSASGLANT